MGLEGTTKHPISKIIASMQNFILFFTFLSIILISAFHFCSPDEESSVRNREVLKILITVMLVLMQIPSFAQIYRVLTISDSYYIKAEYGILAFLNFATYATVLVGALVRMPGLFGYLEGPYSIICALIGFKMFMNNLVTFIAIVLGSLRKKRSKLLSFQEFMKEMDRGLLEIMKQQLSKDFCIEYYNFLKDLKEKDTIYLYENFIKEDSIHELNISKKAREHLEDKVGNLEKSDFNQVREEVMMLIFTNSYQRYLIKYNLL